VSDELNKIPQFKIYYQGVQTVTNDDGFFTISIETETVNSLSLLICKDFDPQFESINTIKNLTIDPKKSYLFYSLTKATLSLLQQQIDQINQSIKPLNMRIRLIDRQIDRQKKYLAQSKSKKKRNKMLYRPPYYKKNIETLRHRKLKITNEIKNKEKKTELFKEKYLAFQNATPQKPAGDFWFITVLL